MAKKTLAQLEARKEWGRKYPDKQRALWRAAYRRKPLNKKHKMLKKSFGISLDQYNQMLLFQNNRCAICGEIESVRSNNKSGGIKSLAVDHCHATGRIRGLLCNRCNIGLGHFKDDIWVLGRTIEYLKQRFWGSV